MKRLSLPLVAVIALLAVPGSALAASARPLSQSTLAYPAAFTATPDGNRILYGERFTGRVMRLDRVPGRARRSSRSPTSSRAASTGCWAWLSVPTTPRTVASGHT